ncbi:MAG: OsmC family protein [Candidatus Thorarchaeota archaeon]
MPIYSGTRGDTRGSDYMVKEDDAQGFTIVIERIQDFEFRVHFDNKKFPTLLMDEPSPLGHDKGPNATRILAGAIGNCLSASLLFCLQRSKLQVDTVLAEVTPTTARNEEGRWRIQHINVKLHISMKEDDPKRFQRCVDIFENYCIVTSSVRQGIPVDVEVIHQE